MTPPTPEQHAAALTSMKRSIEILRAIARNLEDFEAADDINRECAILEGKLMVLEGTPRPAALAA